MFDGKEKFNLNSYVHWEYSSVDQYPDDGEFLPDFRLKHE